MIKVLGINCLIVLLGFSGCNLADPDIPIGHTVSLPEALPACQVKVVEVTDNQVQLEISVNRSEPVSFDSLLLCYSYKNAFPDINGEVKDITSLLESTSDRFRVTLTGLKPSSEYTCRVYVKNWKKSAYSSTKNFVTQADVSTIYWERVAEVESGYLNFGTAYQTEDRVFLITNPRSESEPARYMFEFVPATSCLDSIGELPFLTSHRNWLGIGNKIYSGMSNWIYADQSWWCYDPVLKEWSRRKDIEFPVGQIIANFTMGDKGYLLVRTYEDGIDCVAFIYEYDPEKDTWQKKSRFPGIQTHFNVSAVAGNKAYLVAGYYYVAEEEKEKDKYKYVNAVWEYDVALDQWTEKKPYPGVGRVDMLSGSSDGELFVGFGKATLQTDYVYDWWCYSPAANTWTECPIYAYWWGMAPVFSFSIANDMYIGSNFSGVWKYSREGVKNEE